MYCRVADYNTRTTYSLINGQKKWLLTKKKMFKSILCSILPVFFVCEWSSALDTLTYLNSSLKSLSSRVFASHSYRFNSPCQILWSMLVCCSHCLLLVSICFTVPRVSCLLMILSWTNSKDCKLKGWTFNSPDSTMSFSKIFCCKLVLLRWLN